ncbi:MAG: Ig-like domain-containing protein, partial [Vicinamibacterales bacterium]
MINFGKKVALITVATIGLAVGISNILPSFALTNGGSITALGVPLIENFDTLATSGSTNPWTDNGTLPGWYSQFELVPANPTVYIANAGSTNNGAIYSFGTGTSTERALGSASSGTPGVIYNAVKLTNNAGSTITSLDISFMGEQWRNGGNVTPQTLAFQYRVANVGIVTDANTPAAGWTGFSALDFVSPITGAAAAALDGNATANRAFKSATLAVTVNAGQEVWLRWADINDSGNDHGFGIDDFSVTANGAAVDTAPTVTTTTPANAATNVAVGSNLVINFSESVSADSAFAINCGSLQSFAQSTSPASSFTLNPDANLPYDTPCTVTVTAAQVTDLDGTPDHLATDYVFSFTTTPVDVAPTVTSTTPANGAANVAAGANLVINFSESVTAGASAFGIQCGPFQSFTQSASPGSSFTLNPDADLPYSTNCTVTVSALLISDTDTNDPPDNLASDYSFSFTTAAAPPPGAANVIINEIDADTPGDDAAEFVELYDGGAGNTPLDGLAVVFYQGEDHLSYASFDLDGYTTDASGYFTLGNPGVPGASVTFAPGQFGLLQNGADAVALYVGSATDFPIGTPVTTASLLDAIAYDTDDADDAVLLSLLNPGEPQVNENRFGLKVDQSLQRCTNGSGGKRNTSSYLPATPTPNAPASCTPLEPRPASPIVVSQLYGGGGNSGATLQNDFVELYNRGAATVDISGWSLQYASATGSGWDFNKTPLGGTIAPGQYYLIALASGGAVGAPLPAANVSGLINMGGTTGKIALVDNYDALVTNCPTWNVHVKDFVGYGSTADCHEGDHAGETAAPAPSNTRSIFRKNGGITDTDVNGSDFVTGDPLPRQTAPIVELGPAVVGSDPGNNGVNAPRDATIQVIFTEPVDVVDPWFDITCAASGPHTSVTEAGAGQNHYITPNDNFVPGEQCTVTIFKDQIHDQDLDDSGPFTDTLFANYAWSFTVASGTPPPYPASVHLTMGNPSGAVADTGQPDNYLMEKPEFTLSYNRDLGRPNWVSSHLSDEWFGTLARLDTFRADPAVPPDWYRVQSFDFFNSGFDRGHMVPNADRDKETSVPINQATFLMSNMIAQAPDNNQGPWAALEGELRTLAGSINELYIVTGPEGVGGTGSNGGVTTTVAGDHVAVPANT